MSSIRALLLKSYLFAFLFAMHASPNGKVLVIHNLQNIELTHSDMLRTLKDSFAEVDSFKSSEVLSSRVKLYLFKRPVYDLVILILPISAKAMPVAEKLELLQFFDEGNPIMLVGDGFSVQSWRILLSQFGFDAVSIGDNTEGDNRLFTSAVDSRIFVAKNNFAFSQMALGIKKGIIFDGGAISLSPYENVISWSLLETPENVLFFNQGQAKQIIDRNKMNLVVGAQGINNKARIIALGSFRMLSNELNNESEGDNLCYFNNLISWLRLQTQNLTITNLSICSADDLHCPSPSTFRKKHQIAIKFQVFNEQGDFYEPPEGKIYIHLTKQISIASNEVGTIVENGQKFYYNLLDFLDVGMYKLTIVHNKPGFYIDSRENIKMVNILPNLIDSIELFTLEGLPFLAMIGLVMASALKSMLVLIKGKNHGE